MMVFKAFYFRGVDKVFLMQRSCGRSLCKNAIREWSEQFEDSLGDMMEMMELNQRQRDLESRLVFGDR